MGLGSLMILMLALNFRVGLEAAWSRSSKGLGLGVKESKFKSWAR